MHTLFSLPSVLPVLQHGTVQGLVVLESSSEEAGCFGRMGVLAPKVLFLWSFVTTYKSHIECWTEQKQSTSRTADMFFLQKASASDWIFSLFVFALVRSWCYFFPTKHIKMFHGKKTLLLESDNLKILFPTLYHNFWWEIYICFGLFFPPA